MTSTSATAILASDFSQSLKDTMRTHWTVGKMAHVIAALNGAPVVVTVDRSTGHTEIGVQLVRVYYGGIEGQRVTVRRTFEDGKTQDTNFRLLEIGEAIIPLTREGSASGAKWNALDSYRKHKSAAIKIARREHGEAEGRAWGKWEATPLTLHEVDVTYTPQTGNEAFADQWGTRWYGRIRTEAPATV